MSQRRISSEIWEQLKISYIAGAGLREIARKMNIPEGTVLAHAKRNGWSKQIEVARKQVIAEQGISPVEAIANVISDRKDRSRLNFSKYVVDASRMAAKSDGDLRIARNVKDVAAIHSTIWPEQPQQEGVLGGLHVFSNQAVIQVNPRKEEPKPDSNQ